MKRILIPISILIASCALGANVVTPSVDLIVRNQTTGGTNCTGSALTNVIAGLSTNQQYRMIFDGGPWTVATNVTVHFPTNASIVMLPGCPFNVELGGLVAFNSNSLDAGWYPIFTGQGCATGLAKFIHRWPQWGNENRFVIGAGVLTDTSPTNIYANMDVTTRLDANAIQAMNITVSNWTKLYGITYIPTNFTDTLTVSNWTKLFTTAWAANLFAENVVVSNSFESKGTSRLYAASGQSYNFTPEYTRTVTATVSASRSLLSTELDTIGKYIHNDVTVTVKIPAGTYTNDGYGLAKSGWWGKGTLSIVGDESVSQADTNQDVIFLHDPATADPTTLLALTGDLNIYVSGIRFKIQGTNINNALSLGGTYNSVSGCYFESSGTNRAPGVGDYPVAYISSGADSLTVMANCTIKSNCYGVWSLGGQFRFASTNYVQGDVGSPITNRPDIAYRFRNCLVGVDCTNQWKGRTADQSLQGGTFVITNGSSDVGTW